jgi:hypothetical protein
MQGTCLWRHPLYLVLWRELENFHKDGLYKTGNTMFDNCYNTAQKLVELQEDYAPEFDDVRIDCYRMIDVTEITSSEFLNKKYPALSGFYRPVPRTINMTPCVQTKHYKFYTLNTNTWRYPAYEV